MSIEELFAELVSFMKELSEEELAVFDILTRPGPDLSPGETEAIKKICKELMVLAWRSKRTTRTAVRVEIEKMLDAGLPEKYTTGLFETKCGVLSQYVLEKYPEAGAYAEAG